MALKNTDDSIQSALQRWAVMVEEGDQAYIAETEAFFASDESKNMFSTALVGNPPYSQWSLQRDRALSQVQIIYYRARLDLWAIVDGKLIIPNAIPGATFTDVPGTPQVNVQNNFDFDAGGPYKVVYAVNQLAPNTQKGFVLDELNNVLIGIGQALIKLDKNLTPVEIYDEVNSRWRAYTEFLNADPMFKPVDKPLVYATYDGDDVDSAIVITKEDLETVVVESGLFKVRTEYLIIGDEPLGKRGTQAPGVFDLKSVLEPDDYAAIRQYLTMMPRSMLRNFFMEKVWPGIPWDMIAIETGDNRQPTSARYVEDPIYGGGHYKKQFEDLVWGAFIDLFNEANLEYCNKNSLEPWTWEGQKTDAYYVSSNQESLNELATQIQAYQDVSLALDPKAKNIMEQYAALPKLGDLGLEINRQNAVKELLKRKEYLTAQAIVDAFRYAQDTIIGEQLTKPIPYDITSEDGSTIVRAT